MSHETKSDSTPAGASLAPTARWLGYAGLLPMLAATGLIVLAPYYGVDDLHLEIAVALLYPLLILSFLGGAWWGLAMRAGRRQPGAVSIAIVPTLAAVALAGGIMLTGQLSWGLVAIGTTIAATLLGDRWFVATGLAPSGWMALRVPLSLGLGALAILAGAALGSPTTVY